MFACSDAWMVGCLDARMLGCSDVGVFGNGKRSKPKPIRFDPMLPLHGRLFFFLCDDCGCGCGAVGDARCGAGGADGWWCADGSSSGGDCDCDDDCDGIQSWQLAGATSVLSWLSTRAGLSLRKRHTSNWITNNNSTTTSSSESERESVQRDRERYRYIPSERDF
ncbi:uncharacterized protein LOC26535897 [Drosophila yakuba]|uniref:Uncharacterized protein, isoform A n=1 Tax=Drosophila yakuba TaxID=7245 RepID=A0A0R1E9R4_DROYA|nr:uncharacterized protein LOC26535897 [Drosophila yakuba]KRK06152.1 uncharacterized protein Dyak_GE28716, isoform A [Drosophila yakuba]